MYRRVLINLHGDGNIAMQVDRPEEEIPFNGLGELLCLDVDKTEDRLADAELISPDRMPKDSHMLKTTSLTTIAYSIDWSKVFIAGWKKQPLRPLLYQCYIWQTALICAGMNAILHGISAIFAHCAVLETDKGGNSPLRRKRHGEEYSFGSLASRRRKMSLGRHGIAGLQWEQ